MQTQEIMEKADTPSREGLIIDLEVSLLYRVDPDKAAEIYKKVGTDYRNVIVEPQFRSAIREITASYDAKSWSFIPPNATRSPERCRRCLCSSPKARA